MELISGWDKYHVLSAATVSDFNVCDIPVFMLPLLHDVLRVVPKNKETTTFLKASWVYIWF